MGRDSLLTLELSSMVRCSCCLSFGWRASAKTCTSPIIRSGTFSSELVRVIAAFSFLYRNTHLEDVIAVVH